MLTGTDGHQSRNLGYSSDDLTLECDLPFGLAGVRVERSQCGDAGRAMH